MRITKIEIKNFRLLRDFTIDLEENLSLVIGKNNTGKTSLLCLLEKFLKPSSGNFSFDDFNLEFQKEIKSAFSSTYETSYEPLGISLNIHIEYFKEDDLSNLPILNLKVEENTIILAFEYLFRKENFISFRREFGENNKLELDELGFLRKNLKQYFDKTIKAIDLKDKNNFTIITDKEKIKKIINFQAISAKRGVANEAGDSGKRNKILSKLAYDYFENVDDSGEEYRWKLQKTLIDTDKQLTIAYKDTFRKVTDSIKRFSYDESEVSIKSSLEELNILRENTSVVYKENASVLPEDYNGLGYMNLFAIIFYIHIICDEFKKIHKKEEEPANINLLFIEEPEAHTHPQMQYVFIQNIKKLLEEEKETLNNLQVVITTHSAHITSQSSFNDIKYLLRTDINTVIAKNLKDLENKYSFDETEKRNFQFLKQYLTLHKSELFFSDKIIFIEGDTERILLPAMMKKIDNDHAETTGYQPLLSQNISTVDVGTNSKIFEKFLEFLGIKTLVITDLDSVKNIEQKDKTSGEIEKNKDGTPKTKQVGCNVIEGTETSNDSLIFFLRKKILKELIGLSEEGKILARESDNWVQDENGQIYIAYQTEENEYHARSFEDSFFALNLEFIRSNKDNFNSLKNKDKLDQSHPDFYDIADNCVKKKPGFATEILFYSDEAFTNWKVPEYITKGLLWLAQ